MEQKIKLVNRLRIHMAICYGQKLTISNMKLEEIVFPL